MERIAREQGVEIHLNTEVEHLDLSSGLIKSVQTNQGNFEADLVVSGADYEHTDQELLPENFRGYSQKYWDERVLSPSSLLFYLGLDHKIEGIKHHSLFFDESLDLHAEEIYTSPQWPSRPLFYACCTSVTDPSGAPPGGENLFLLMPIAPGLHDTPEIREKYFEILMDRLEKATGQDIRKSIRVKRSYAIKEFIEDYHSFKGNAYGLANTLMQTAFLKPKMQSRKVKNLLLTGQLTVPGPGVPPSIISGEIAALEADKYFN
jgi:phytoene desaturase